VHEARRCGRLSPRNEARNIFQAYVQYAQQTFNITRAHAQALPATAAVGRALRMSRCQVGQGADLLMMAVARSRSLMFLVLEAR
jgi:hypothetical protein